MKKHKKHAKIIVMTLSITPQLVIEAAKKRGWQVVMYPNARGLYKLIDTNDKTHYFKGQRSNKVNDIADFISTHKDVLQVLAPEIGIEVPDSIAYDGNMATAKLFMKRHTKIVVKPSSSAHGDGVTTNVQDLDTLKTAIETATSQGGKVLLQQQIDGDDYRVLIIGGKIAAAAIREPASVLGDGKSSVGELITLTNNSSKRAVGYNRGLSLIDLSAAERFLGDHISDIPKSGQLYKVVGTANIGTGGRAIDVTDILEESMKVDALKIANELDMGICGVDFIVSPEGQRYLIELNAKPSLGLHEYPAIGKPRHTPDLFLDWISST